MESGIIRNISKILGYIFLVLGIIGSILLCIELDSVIILIASILSVITLSTILIGISVIVDMLEDVNYKIHSLEMNTRANESSIGFNNNGRSNLFGNTTSSVSQKNWKCVVCGKVNAGYVGTCSCGQEKE